MKKFYFKKSQVTLIMLLLFGSIQLIAGTSVTTGNANKKTNHSTANLGCMVIANNHNSTPEMKAIECGAARPLVEINQNTSAIPIMLMPLSFPEIDVKQGATAIASGTGSYDYGSHDLATNTDIVFTIQNTGARASSLSSFTITGADASQFSFQGTNPTTVASPGSVTFTVRFAPSGTGVKTATVSFDNEDSNEDPYTFTIQGTGETSGPANPTSFSATASSTSQIDLSWVLNGNSDPVLFAYNTTSTFGTPTGTYSVSDPITGGGTVLYAGSNLYYDHTPLIINTHYYYKIWSMNESDEYSSGATDDEWTLVNVPSSPIVNNPTMTTLDVAIVENENPATVEYAIHETTLDKFIQSDGKPGASPFWQTAALWGTKTVTELDTNTTYIFEVKARNGGFTETGYGNSESESTSKCYMGEAWTSRTMPAGVSIQPMAVAYGNNIFVAVGDGSQEVLTSPDGITWTANTIPEACRFARWTSVVYANGLFVAVAGSGTNRVMTSPDGVTWTARDAAQQNEWMSVTYGNGKFVAVSRDGTNRVMTSTNGTTWTMGNAAESTYWNSVIFANNKFVAVASDGTKRVMTSPDGIAWTSQITTGNTNQWQSVTYGNGIYVAVANVGTNRAMTSPDGITWTNQITPTGPWYSVAYGNGLFVAVGAYAVPVIQKVMTSPDGVNWTARTSANDASWWRSIVYANDIFVAVANSGTKIMTSDCSPVLTVTTEDASTIATSSATGNGTIVMAGLTPPTDRGVIFYPYTDTDKIIGGTNVTNVHEAGTFSAGAFTAALTSLSVNVRYNARAHATDASNGTAYGGRVNFWTLANVPAAPTVSNPTTTTLNVSVNVNANPATTQFAIFDTVTDLYVQANGSLGASAIWQTSTGWGTKTVIGLTAGTEYTFKVKARNGGNTETSYGTTASGTPVSAPTVTTQAASAMTATSATGNGNITSTNGFDPTNRGVIYYEYTNTDLEIGSTGVTNVDEDGSPTFSTGAFTRSLTGLSVNTRYNARAHATNSVGTGYGSRADFWTLANVPSAPTVNNPTATTLDVAVNANSNPAITEFAIHETTTAKFVQADGTLGATEVWATAATWGTKTVTGLTAGTTYTFEVKARNGKNIETAYGTTATGTPEATPTVTTQAASSITATSATGNGNITATNGVNPTNRGVIYYEYTNTDLEIGGAGVTNVDEDGSPTFSTGAFTRSLTGLSVNTRYNARAHATNSVGTGYGSRVDFWTLANVPSAPTVNNATATTLDVSINSNSNPAITEFAIHETSTDKFVQANGSLGATAVWATATTWATKTVTGLTTGTEYTFEVKARNGANVETAYGTTATGTPEATPTVTTQAASAITATSVTGNGNITATNGVNPTNRGVIYYEYTNTDLEIGGAGVTNVDENGAPTFSTGAFTRSLTGLSVNTRYNARAHATNTIGTGYGSRVDFWTLANVLSAPTVNNATATTLDVAINANSNPATTEFAIHETSTDKFVQANGSLGATAVWATAATWATKTVTGLTTGTEYTFEVKARNGANVETAYGTTATGTPEAAPTVTTQAASAITATSVTGNGNITATNGVNPTNRGVIYYEYTNTDLLIGGTGVTNVDEDGAPTFSTGAFTRSLTGLSVNTRYNARAHATNTVGTGYGSRVDFWTLANVPGKPTLDGVTASSFDVTLDVNSNPAITEFTIRVKYLDGINPNTKYVNHTTGNLQDAADWQTNATWSTKTVSGLDVGKEYTVDVKARSNATPQVETAFGDEETVVTCKNPDLAGEIAADQTICYNTTPETLTSVSPATEFGGTLEYKWQKSTTSEVAGFTDIPSSNSASYSPGVLTQTTWYKRLARVDCKPDWTGAVATNVVKITVDHTPPSVTAKNNTIYLNPSGQYTLAYTEVLSAWSDSETSVDLNAITMNPQTLTCAQLGQTIPVTVTVPDMCGNETSVTSNITVLEGNTLLPPWQSCNTSPAANGSSTYSPCTNNGTFYLTSKGLSTTTNDVMHFVYQPLTGNGTIITRIADVKNDGWAGVMMRESCAPNAKTILFKTRLYNPTVVIGTRTTTGKSITNTSQSQPNLRWMKIQRNGNTFQIFVSANGTSWTRAYTATIAMNNTIYAGIFTDNYTSSKTTQAWFDKVELSNTLKSGDDFAEAEILIEANEKADVQIYPNPAKEQVNILLPGWATCNASLISAEGKVLKTFTISTIETKLDVQDLKPGLYILRFESEEDIVIKRLVIH